MTDYATEGTLKDSTPKPQVNISYQGMIWRRFFKHRGAVVGAIVLTVVFLSVILAGLSPYDPNEPNMKETLQSPSLFHPMGTDALGRDYLTRVLYGGRVSLAVGVMVVMITLTIGVTIGAIAGYFGGWLDTILMRFTDAVLTMPAFLILILLSTIMREIELPFFTRNNVIAIAVVIGLLSWMTFARLTRAAILTLREMDYVKASISLGGSHLRVITRHILPNMVGLLVVEATLELSYAIIEESGLSFLGFGIQPPTPSWGNLLSNASEHFVKHPWLAIYPGVMIFLTIISVNYIGDGLRDAFDPYKVLQKVGEV